MARDDEALIELGTRSSASDGAEGGSAPPPTSSGSGSIWSGTGGQRGASLRETVSRVDQGG